MQTAISTFDDRAAAERAVERLVDAGFSRDEVHIEEGSATEARATASGATDADRGYRDEGILASFGHFFASLFEGDERGTQHAGTYSEAVRRGSVVVVVDAVDETQAQQAATIMDELGAVNMDQRADEWRAEGWAYDRMPAQALRGEADDGSRLRGDQDKVLNVVQEELQVGKRTVDRGGVRIVQRVSETPVRELVRLREVRAVVERRPVDRAAGDADLKLFQDGVVEVREMSEEPVVAKTARVVEEVVVGKEAQERTEEISDTVRRKDVDVERLEARGSTVSREEHAEAAARRDPAYREPRNNPTDRNS